MLWAHIYDILFCVCVLLWGLHEQLCLPEFPRGVGLVIYLITYLLRTARGIEAEHR